MNTTVPNERLGGPLGLGVSIGVPTGLSGKLWMGQQSAVQFNLGSTLGHINDVAATADLVLEFRPIRVEGGVYSIPIHVGGGMKFTTDFTVPGALFLMGPRVPVGATLLVPDLPVDFHVEVAPAIILIEQPGWAVDGQIGIRYYF